VNVSKPSVFVCWAEGTPAWETTVTAFVDALNASGSVDATFHKHDRDRPEGDWPRRFEQVMESPRGMVLIAVDPAWRAAWMDLPDASPGAAFESRLIRGEIASRRREWDDFMVVVLPGASAVGLAGAQDTVQRFEIETLDASGLANLLTAIRRQADKSADAWETDAPTGTGTGIGAGGGTPGGGGQTAAGQSAAPARATMRGMGADGAQWALGQYLYAELEHSIGAYRAADHRLVPVREMLLQPLSSLERAAAAVTTAAADLNVALQHKRYAVPPEGEDHRQPQPPALTLTDAQESLIGDFYAIARQSMSSASPSRNLELVRDAILLGRDAEQHQARLHRRYAHRGGVADTVFNASDAARARKDNAARTFAYAGVSDDTGGAITGDVLKCLAQAHMDLHQVEHDRSLPVGQLLGRVRDEDADGTDRDTTLLWRSVTLNTFTYAICEAMPWIFASDIEREAIQLNPGAARETIVPSAPMWVARQVELLSLYRRAHGYRLLGDHQRAYNDLRKLQRIGRVLRTQLDNVEEKKWRLTTTAYVETLDALAEYRIGELYRADHDYMQALVHLCRSHDRMETQTAFEWGTGDKALIEISLRIGKGKAFFEIGAFKRSLKWFSKAWLALLDLMASDDGDTHGADDPVLLLQQLVARVRSCDSSARRDLVQQLAKELLELMRADIAEGHSREKVIKLTDVLDHVKHESEIDKDALRSDVKPAFDEIIGCAIPDTYKVLAADILQRIGHVAMVLRLEKDSEQSGPTKIPLEERLAERLLRHAADLDPGNLLVRTGILRCELRLGHPAPSQTDPMTCWTSGASDVDQAIRAGEHAMLDRLAQAMIHKKSRVPSVVVARALGKHFMTHTDSINLRGAVQHLYLTRERAEARGLERAEGPATDPYLEFVCLRRFGCVTPFMPRPAAVSAVGGGYLIRVCWPDSTSARPPGKESKPHAVFNVLVDPGEGVVNNLYSAGLGIADIDMVVATHDHPDHITALDALVSLRNEHERIGGNGMFGTTQSPMVILGNDSVHSRYGFLNGKGKYSVQHINDATFSMQDVATRHLAPKRKAGKSFADTMLTIRSLATRHDDNSGNRAMGFVLEFAVPSRARPWRITFMSDTGIGALVSDDTAQANAEGAERQRWDDAMANDIVVAHVSDVPTDEIRQLAELTTDDDDDVTSFDEGVRALARHRQPQAERLMHALSIARKAGDRPLVPARLFENYDGGGRRESEHLYLHGLLAVAELMRAKSADDDIDGRRRVLVIGEFREELGSFRGTIAREINRSVFSRLPEESAETAEHPCRAFTADIGLRIRLGSEGKGNRVLCSTCSLNNDRLDVERFHAPERMREVCVKGDHEAMYWSCDDHDPGARERPIFVEQMNGYDPFSAGGRYHG
jgi:tetratricopeptide (TPR) repeat protein